MMRGSNVRMWSIVLVVAACGPSTSVQEAAAPPAPPEPPPGAPAPGLVAAAAPPAQAACVDEPGMVYIAGGDYVSERYQKTYPVPAFWIDRTEVTVAAFRAFVEAGYSPPQIPSGRSTYLVCTWQLPDADNLPINCLNGYQQEAFCLWAGKRLPTAPEWGWAAQGREERRRYPWGDALPSCELAVIGIDRDRNLIGCGRNQPWPVGSKPTDMTRDGVLDMMGNLGEPTSTGRTEGDEQSTRIIRGTSWATRAFASSRVDQHGGFAVREAWSDNTGIRCAKNAGSLPPCARASNRAP